MRKAVVAVVVLLLLFLIQMTLFYSYNMTEQDISFQRLEWSEACDGKVYTAEEKKYFCGTCLSGGDCGWPLDMYFDINLAKPGWETHCLLELDGVNYLERGRYYGITDSSFFTWQVTPANESHHIRLCCGVEKEMHLFWVIPIEKGWPQACVEKSIGPRCET